MSAETDIRSDIRDMTAILYCFYYQMTRRIKIFFACGEEKDRGKRPPGRKNGKKVTSLPVYCIIGIPPGAFSDHAGGEETAGMQHRQRTIMGGTFIRRTPMQEYVR